MCPVREKWVISKNSGSEEADQALSLALLTSLSFLP